MKMGIGKKMHDGETEEVGIQRNEGVGQSYILEGERRWVGFVVDESKGQKGQQQWR